MSSLSSRVGVFGWGIVAPKSPNISAFSRNLSSSGTWLCPFHGFGPGNFLVGHPEFRFEDYQEWIDRRFAPAAFSKSEREDGPSLPLCHRSLHSVPGSKPGNGRGPQGTGQPGSRLRGYGPWKPGHHSQRQHRPLQIAAPLESFLVTARTQFSTALLLVAVQTGALNAGMGRRAASSRYRGRRWAR